MADTLTREAIAFGSQPLSPVPQYWTGTSYEKVQGANGAPRGTIYNSSGVEIFTSTVPAHVVITSNVTSIISGTSTVNYSGTGTVEVVTSAGGSAYFSNTNPANMGLLTSAGSSFLFTPTNPGHVEIVSSAGNTFTTTSPGLVTVLNASSSGTAVFGNTSPAYMTKSIINRQVILSGTQTFSSGATATSILTYSITGPITAAFTTPNHEIFISNDSPYDITATVYKTVSANGTFNTDIGVSFLVPKINANIGAKSSQIQGLFNFNQGINVVLTITATTTATVTTNLLIKELDL